MKRTWREAEAFCEEFGAHLASFAHIEEENFVNKLLYSKFNWYILVNFEKLQSNNLSSSNGYLGMSIPNICLKSQLLF